MRRFWLANLVLLATAWLAGAAHAQRAQGGPEISVDRQQLLRRKLLVGSDSLLAQLRRNAEAWEKATPEQRQLLRQQAVALRDASPREWQRIMDAWKQFVQMPDQQQEEYRRRAAWLAQVMANITSEQKRQLLQLPTEQRAAELIRLRDELQAAGKIRLDEPPATQPTPPTQPAGQPAN